MGINNVLTCRQPETRPPFARLIRTILGGEVGVKNLFQLVNGNTRSKIPNCQVNGFVLLVKTNDQLTTLRHRLPGIDQQVQ